MQEAASFTERETVTISTHDMSGIQEDEAAKEIIELPIEEVAYAPVTVVLDEKSAQTDAA